MKTLLLAAAAFALTAAGQAPERAAPQAGARVMLEGCVKPGTTMACRVVDSGGWLYDVTGLSAQVGDYLHGSAQVAPGAGPCGQGVPVRAYQPDGQPPKTKACPRDLIAHPTPK